ncbi:MAG: ADOP family duplicated permease [Terracidiphilus sp.]
MPKLRALWLRILEMFHPRLGSADFDAELASHVEMHTDDGIRAGLTPEEARRQALIRLGGVEQTKQAWRERRTLPWLEMLWQDIRFGLRILCKNPGYTAVAVLTLALGIGANSAVFTVAQAALLRSWPAKEPGRLARLISMTSQGEDFNFSYADYQDLAAQSRSLEGILACSRHAKALRVGTETKFVLDDVVSPNYFSVLGIDAQLGRTFSADSRPDSEPGVVISDSLWHRAFNADPSLVGKQVWLTNRAFTVLGIAPPGFRGLGRGVPTDLWLPVATEYPSQELTDRKSREFDVLGRLRPGVTAAEAQVELDTLGRRLALAYPAIDKARNIALVSEQERLRQAMVPTLILMTAVGLVLLICCANVAGLVLARADARSKEVAMRLALGAGRLRLMRQLLTESLLLASLGAALGLLLAAGLLRLQPALMPPAEFELGLDLHLDAPVLAFTAAAALLSVLVFGLAPAIQASKTSLVPALRGEGTGAVRGVRRWTMRNALVLGEIALSVVLLTASGLVVRSLLFSRSLPLGFDRQRQLIFFDLVPGIAGYHSERSANFFNQMEEKAAALPGVRHAALARRVLLSDSEGGMAQRVSIPGVELPQGQLSVPIKFDTVDGNYFRAIGTRLIEGREFTSVDNPSTGRVVVVSQTMAERFWPRQEVLGQQIVADGTACQIVGVVEDAKINSIHETPEPYMYFPFAQLPSEDGTLIVDAESNPKALTARMLSEIQRVDRNVPVSVRTVHYLMQQAFWADQMAAGLVGALGLLGIFLGAIGLYGVVAFTVNRRSREIGIRMALGAERRDVLRLVLGHGLALAAIGAGIGLVASFAAMRLLSTLLYGVRPTDPLTFAGSSALVILVALAASWFPARRAASIDPMQSLRTE